MGGQLTRVVFGVFRVQLLSKLLVWVGLDAQGLANGEDLEQEGQLVSKSLCDCGAKKLLVILDELNQGALCLKILGGE